MSDTSSSGNEPVSAVRKFQVRVRTKPNHGSIGGSGEGTPIGTPPTTSAVFVNRTVHNNTGSPAAASLSSSPVTTTTATATSSSSSSATTVANNNNEETTTTTATAAVTVVPTHSPASSPVNSPRVITSSIVKRPIRRISTQPTSSPSSDSPSTPNNNNTPTTTTTATATAVTSNHVPPPVPPTSGVTIVPSRRDISVPMPTRKSLSANGSVVGSTSERIIQSALFNRRISSTVPQLVQDSPLSSSPNTTTATTTAPTTTANNTSTSTESAQTEKNTSDDTSASAPSSPSSTNTLAGSSTRSHRYSITNTLQQRLQQQQQQQPDDASPNNSNNNNNNSRRYSSSWGSTTHMGYKNTLKLLNKDQANQLYGECDVKCYYLMNPLYDEQEASPEVQYHLTSDECKLYDQVIQRIQEIGKDPNNHLIVQYETMVAQAVRDDQNYKPMLQKRLAQGSDAINLSRRRLMNLNGSATDGAPLPSAANNNSVEEKSSEEILLEESMNHNNNNNKRHSIAQCSKGWKQQMRARDMNTPFVFNQRAPISTTNLMKQSYPWMNQMVMRHYLATQ